MRPLPPALQFRSRQDRPLITDGDEQNILVALEGLPFPAPRRVVLAHASMGGVGTHVLTALDRLADRVFSSAADVVISIPDDRGPADRRR